MKRQQNLEKAIVTTKVKINVYLKKLEFAGLEKEFRTKNYNFVLFRRRFYRNVTNSKPFNHNVITEQILQFWSTIWIKKD
ncbi:hypothetical protein NUSPORA_02171 [Nucleospora cyclopteri]